MNGNEFEFLFRLLYIYIFLLINSNFSPTAETNTKHQTPNTSTSTKSEFKPFWGKWAVVCVLEEKIERVFEREGNSAAELGRLELTDPRKRCVSLRGLSQKEKKNDNWVGSRTMWWILCVYYDVRRLGRIRVWLGLD